jgi:hypothetical protein
MPADLTPAQRRALDWLPATGEWRRLNTASNDDWFALYELTQMGLADAHVRWGWWRLTPAGVAERGRVG